MPLAHKPRLGFTLVELIIALSLALTISGAVLALVQHREQLYRDLAELLAVRMHIYDATAILSAELRGASDSIWSATNTSLELSTTVGVGIVCAVPSGAPPGQTLIELTPDSSTGIAPSSFLSAPDSLDAISLYNDSSTLTPTRGWRRYTLLHTARPLAKNTCLPTTGFTTPADISTSRHAYELLLANVPSPTPHPGSPARILRRARYSLYRAADGLWYLGYQRCTLATPTTCATVQPVSGPYAGSSPPLSFRYYGATGMELTSITPSTVVTRIDVVAYAATPTPVRLPGAMNAPFVDSSRTTIALRNAQ